jgi:hypothetical protein
MERPGGQLGKGGEEGELKQTAGLHGGIPEYGRAYSNSRALSCCQLKENPSVHRPEALVT